MGVVRRIWHYLRQAISFHKGRGYAIIWQIMGLTRGFEPLFLRTEMFPLQSVFLEKVNQVPTFGCTNMFPLRLRMHLRDCS